MLLRLLSERIPAIISGAGKRDADIGGFAASLAAELKYLRKCRPRIEAEQMFPGESLSLFPKSRRLAVLNGEADLADWRHAAAVRLFRVIAGGFPGMDISALDRMLDGVMRHPAVAWTSGVSEFIRSVLGGTCEAEPERHLSQGMTFREATILNFVAVGSTSLVYRALLNGRECALKLPRPGAEARFMDELALWRRLKHPNLPRLFGWGGDEGPYCFLEFCRTGRKAVDAEAAPGFLRALDYLHGEDLLHGDLRLGNLGVAPDGRPVLLDLSHARAGASEEESEREVKAIGELLA